jgi:DNA invertase Pin-like site-specific DNA recombinase
VIVAESCLEPRYAWWGRTSTEDEQDPTLSLPRQYRNCEGPVERSGGRIVACYYDIESGAGSYGRGGRTITAGLGIHLPLPRDGGLRELLAAGGNRPRPFDRVIVESISRLSRNSGVTFRIEDELLQLGVRLCAADEPLEENFGTIVLRHVNVGIARGYHHELMVKSREGLETSVRQGWHAGGIALYGYVLAVHPHPNPRKAARGLRKRTLEPDPVRAPVVRHIYDLYLSGGLGVTQIADRLNESTDRFPPPTSVDPARSLNRWSRTSVWEVLHNPKYTGYQVWNRRARKKDRNRVNPPGSWVWSEEPAHAAIVSREEYDAVHHRAAHNMRSRQGDRPAEAANGRGRAVYLYRGRLRCGLCGQRMWGNHRRNSTYYSCQPKGRAATIYDHPANVYLNEKRLNTAVLATSTPPCSDPTGPTTGTAASALPMRAAPHRPWPWSPNWPSRSAS